MRVLVTGGSGLVGRALQRSDKTYEYIYLTSGDGDLCDRSVCQALFDTHKPQAVVHLAACVGGLFRNMAQKVRMLEDNARMNLNVVACAHAAGVRRLVACLSTCIFPDGAAYPISEEDLHRGPPHPSNDAYAYAKRLLEIQCRAYRENYGVDFLCVVPTNIYGTHDNFSLQEGHVIPALIHRCYLAHRDKTDFVVAGTGRPLRQFILSDDVARFVIWLLETYRGAQTSFILSPAPAQEVSIAHVATAIARSFDYEHRLLFDTTRADGQPRKTADNARLVAAYGGDLRLTPVHRGIPRVVQWFREHYAEARR